MFTKIKKALVDLFFETTTPFTADFTEPRNARTFTMRWMQYRIIWSAISIMLIQVLAYKTNIFIAMGMATAQVFNPVFFAVSASILGMAILFNPAYQILKRTPAGDIVSRHAETILTSGFIGAGINTILDLRHAVSAFIGSFFNRDFAKYTGLMTVWAFLEERVEIKKYMPSRNYFHFIKEFLSLALVNIAAPQNFTTAAHLTGVSRDAKTEFLRRHANKIRDILFSTLNTFCRESLVLAGYLTVGCALGAVPANPKLILKLSVITPIANLIGQAVADNINGWMYNFEKTHARYTRHFNVVRDNLTSLEKAQNTAKSFVPTEVMTGYTQAQKAITIVFTRAQEACASVVPNAVRAFFKPKTI